MDPSVRSRLLPPTPIRLAILTGASIALACGLVAARVLAPTSAPAVAIPPPTSTERVLPPPSSPAAARPATPETPVFARVADLLLHVPARRFTAIAYHEASFSNALRMHPRGRCVRNENRTKLERPEPARGPRFTVMSSRGRANPATSAVDVAMPTHDAVLSPVTGRVKKVKRYKLYGRYPDFRIVLAPADTVAVRVVLLHLRRVVVREGSAVVAGVTRLGRPRPLPFRSQINDYVGPDVGHIHLEVKKPGAQAGETPP